MAAHCLADAKTRLAAIPIALTHTETLLDAAAQAFTQWKTSPRSVMNTFAKDLHACQLEVTAQLSALETSASAWTLTSQPKPRHVESM